MNPTVNMLVAVHCVWVVTEERPPFALRFSVVCNLHSWRLVLVPAVLGGWNVFLTAMH